MLNGSMPIYSQFGDNIYASDVVQQAVNCIATEMKKLTPLHVRQKSNSDIVPIVGNVQTMLNNPNPLMTTSEFLEKIIWNLYLNYNSFIIPIFHTEKDKSGTQRRIYTGIYPVQPRQVDFLEDASGRLFVTFDFGSGETTTLPYDDVIHVKYRYSVNEYMGGNEFGQPDNAALLKTLDLNETLLDGVAKAMKASYAVNGIVKYKTLIDDGKTEIKLQALEKKLNNSQSGFLGMDLSSEYIPIDRKLELVDAETLKFIDEKILRHFGVPLCILTGDYTKAQYEAFYQKTLEPLIIALTQAFTKTLFTRNEIAHGNKVQFFPKNMIFMSMQETLEMVRLLGDSGTIYENEKRVAFGYMPLAELEGVRMQSLNYVDVSIAQQYQAGEETNAENGSDSSDGGNDGNDGNNLDEVKEMALNGAQVTALIGVIQSYKDGILSKQQAINIIMISFGLSYEDSLSMVEGDETIDEGEDQNE